MYSRWETIQINNSNDFQICSRNHFSNTFHFSIAFDFLFRVSKQEIKSDGKVKSDFIGSWIKKQNLVTFPSLFGRHFSYMCDVRPFLIGTVKYEFLVFRFQKLVLCSHYRWYKWGKYEFLVSRMCLLTSFCPKTRQETIRVFGIRVYLCCQFE